MLNNRRRFIYICMCLFFLIFFVVLIIFDMKNLYYSLEKNIYIKEENCICVEDLYIKLSKEFQDTQQKNKNVQTKENAIKDEEKSISKINIYSTNPWRIKIPKLRLDAPITEGTSQEELRRTVGHFKETNKWEGNVALAGHNRGYRCNFFQEIKNLQKGDIIIYCTEKGEKRYRVTTNTVIKETDWSYIKDTKDNRITLITCEINKKEYRRCIQAIETTDNKKNMDN